MTAPISDAYVTLAMAARPLLAGVVAKMHAAGIDPSEAVCVVHTEDCPCCAGKTDRLRAPGALVGVAPRSFAAVAPRINEVCRDAMLWPLTPGHMLCLLSLRGDDLVPVEVELPS